MINRTVMIETFEETYGTVGDPLSEETWANWLGIWSVAWREAESALFKTLEEARRPER